MHGENVVKELLGKFVGTGFYLPPGKAVFQIGGVNFAGLTEFYGQADLLLIAVKFFNDITKVLSLYSMQTSYQTVLPQNIKAILPGEMRAQKSGFYKLKTQKFFFLLLYSQ